MMCTSVLVVTGYVPQDTTEWPCIVKDCRGQHSNGWVTWTDIHPMAVRK